MASKSRLKKNGGQLSKKETNALIVDKIPEVTNPEGEKIHIEEEKFINLKVENSNVGEMTDFDDPSLRRSQRIRTKPNDGVFKIPSKSVGRINTRNNAGVPKSPQSKKKKKYPKPEEVSTVSSSADVPELVDMLTHNGIQYARGDIVSCVDDDQNVYYAIIRGLLVDRFCEKSVVITWLLKTTTSPPPGEQFDPQTYLIGPDEELPRKLEYFDFVMHNPDYYFAPKYGHPKLNLKSQKEFLAHYFKDLSYHEILNEN